MIKNEFYDIEDYQNLWDFLNKAFTYSVYCNYQRNFRYKRGRIPIEIMKEYGSPKINPDLLGIFPPLICDYPLNVITKGGYHVLKSDTQEDIYACIKDLNEVNLFALSYLLFIMFEQLQTGFEKIVRTLRGEGKITEENIADTLRQVRRILLEADVNYKVVKKFIQGIQEKAVGVPVTKSLTPGQMVIKIIHDQLTSLLGQNQVQLKDAAIPPMVIMLVGLQGTGKTTTAAKLGYYLRAHQRNPLLVPLDLKRPAAVEQLQYLGKQHDLSVFVEGKEVVERAKAALSHARQTHRDVVILDTAGRLHLDEELMAELVTLKNEIKPHNIILVVDGMTGQDAVNTAISFDQRLDLDGMILTKMDSDSRGGAALSIVKVTGKPIQFIGTGEKIADLEIFHPDRIASRILGLADIVSLVEKVQSNVSLEEAQKVTQNLYARQFTLNDFLSQLQQVKKLGPLENILANLPGFSRAGSSKLQVDNRELIKAEAIIQSMTIAERNNPMIINGSRRRRIALGSGTTPADVNRLLNQYWQVVKMSKQLRKMKIPRDFSALGLNK